MRIRILYTGGTIGMKPTVRGLAPGADVRGWLASRIAPSLPDRVELSYGELAPLMDSSNASPESWQHIVDALRTAYDEGAVCAPGSNGALGAFVVLHGTDTMAYAAAALSYALVGFPAPVVLTGAQLPLGTDGSDAAANVTGAIRAAAEARAEGVALFFGGRLLQGNRATKTSSWDLDAYRSPNAPQLANHTKGATPLVSPEHGHTKGAAPFVWPEPPLPYGDHDVAVIELVPGISARRVAAALDPLPEALLLRAYGAGNAPSDDDALLDALARAVSAGCPVVVCSQCPQADIRLDRYETGAALARIGAVGAGDMCFEAAYAKVVFLLSQGLRDEELASWIPRPIAGEVT